MRHKAQTGRGVRGRCGTRRSWCRLLRLPPSRAAAVVVASIERDKARVLVGSDAIMASFFERLLPVRYWSLLVRLSPSLRPKARQQA